MENSGHGNDGHGKQDTRRSRSKFLLNLHRLLYDGGTGNLKIAVNSGKKKPPLEIAEQIE